MERKTKEEIINAAKGSVVLMPKFGDYLKLFEAYKATVKQIMPEKAIEADRVLTICAKVFSESEYLQKCSIPSMIGAVIQAALHGMNPDPSAGLVYFVPYGGAVKLMLGYKGQELQAYKSGLVESISAHCIYEGDSWQMDFASKEKIWGHVPGQNWGVNDSKIIWAYSKFWMKGGGVVCQPINRAMIEKRRAASSNASNDPKKNPWIANYRQMAEKSAIKETADHAPKHDDWRDIEGQIFPDLDIFKRDRSGQLTDEPLTAAEILPNDPPATTATEPTDAERQAEIDAQLKKEQDLFNSGKP